MALVSVVIPTHNRARCIERAISSVLAQTCADFELIVVDDGSTDDTARVVEECARKDSRIRLIEHRHRKGAQAARNTGIFAAAGKWIAFLDSDDEWLHDSLTVRLQLSQQGEFQVVHSECYVANQGSMELRLFGHPSLQGRVYQALLRKPGTLFPSLLISKDCLKRIGYLDETILSYQEWETSIRLAKYYRFAFVGEPTFIYDRHSADTISRNLLRTAQGYEQVVSKHHWSILRHLGPKALASHYYKAAELYREAKDERRACCCSNMAIVLWPFRPRTIWRGIYRVLRSGF